MSYFSDVERDLVVAARTVLADGIVALDLVAHNGRDLPAWEPGSHVDLIFSDARVPAIAEALLCLVVISAAGKREPRAPHRA